MKTNQYFVNLNEISLRVNKLHKALEALGYSVESKEVKSHKAGSDILE